MLFKIVRNFFSLDIAGGILLVFMTLLALTLANTSLEPLYHSVLDTPLALSIGDFSIQFSLHHFIGDGLMAIFFLLVGLEIKRELLIGELSSLSKAIAPVIAAVGGMMVPAIIYFLWNANSPEALKGWAIPSATDIAFTLGVLTLLGNKVPVTLKIFLTALAIIDDLGAILIIAFFYNTGLNMDALSYGVLVCFVLLCLNYFKVARLFPYLFLGLFLWYFVYQSGLHATISGVLLALFVPLKIGNKKPLLGLEKQLHSFVAFLILPIFAAANAGVTFVGMTLVDILHPIALGIITGLFFGKIIGIFLFTYCAYKIKLISLPSNTSLKEIFGGSILCGIGFTMSILIGGIAFGTNEEYINISKVGILMGSSLSALCGYFFLKNIKRPISSKKNI